VSTGFEKEGEKQKAKSKWQLNLFKKKDPNDDIYANFKRMVMEVEARNLIIDKVVYETERDALKEFRLAHPALMCCPHCTDCFLSPNDLHTHAADKAVHEAKSKAEADTLIRFAPVENAFLGAFGRKLTAHRLLYSVELNGMQARLDVVSEQPYRPNIADPQGKRAEQLRNKALVLGADPRAGVRPMHIHNNLAIQHRTTWATDHGGLTLQDTLTELMHIRDEPIDVCMVSTLGGHVEVNIEWRGYIRFDVYLIGEFNGWKPEMMYPRPDGVYSSVKSLAPGRYQYRFIADGVEKHEESASTTVCGDKTNNTLLVVSPLVQAEGLTLSKSINLRNSFLYDDGANALARCMHKNSHITSLDLSFNNISDEGMLGVAEACNCLLQLRVLKLNGNGFTYDGCRFLVETYSSSEHLEVLELSSNRIADDGVEVIGRSIERHKKLQVLNLDSNFIGDDGASCLGTSLQFNKTVTVLTLSNNMIRTAGSERLCFFLRNNGTLKELNLSSNPLGPDGVRNVGDMLLYAENLEKLDISHTQMMLAQSSQGLLSLTISIRRNRGLKVLKLKGNHLDNDAALEIAYGLSGNRTLTALDLSNNPIVSQWFESNKYLKTKLLAKMPTIQTSIDRNIRIHNDPELHARWQTRPKEYDENPAGQWTKRRKWKPDKAIKVISDEVAAYEGEDLRQRAEEEFIVDGLFAHAVTVTEFLNSREGANFITCVAKLIVHYVRSLSIQKDNSPDWLESSHLAVISGILTECQQECDVEVAASPVQGDKKLAPILDQKDDPNKLLAVTPPPLVEDFIQVVPVKCIPMFFRKIAIKLDDAKLQDIIESCLIPGESDDHVIGVRKFVKLFVKNYEEFVPSGINGSLSRMMLKPPLALARNLIYSNSINTKRLELRNYYRGQPDKRPLFLCNGCGRRFSSLKSESKHLERIKKEHLKFANIEELWLSQNYFLRRAKYLQSGCQFPTYYELGDTILLPRYYCPQIFDKWGDEGRPIGVIEPKLTYKTEDILGNMIQV
jgi:Ran GTPase-activating protein (RanGAP) involved in mRNA processing and transport